MLEIQEKDFEARLKFEDYDPDDLIQNGVVPSRRMYIEKQEALEHQMNILESLVKDMRKAQKECADKKEEIVAKISEIPCAFLNENEKVLDANEIIK